MSQNLKLPDDLPDQRLRDQLFEGCRLARELEERLRSIPPGNLADPTGNQLRYSLAIASVDAISAFNEGIKLLLISTNYPSDSGQIPATNSPRQCVDQPLPPPPQKRAFNSASWKGIAAEQGPIKRISPPLSPHGLAAINVYPNSNSVRSINIKRLSTSSPSGSICMNSPTSEMSEGSPTNDASETAGVTTTSTRGSPRKGKLLPKITLKMPAGSFDQGGDSTPPDDGHSWRKYGQKEILGARFPRSYYRCTHKTDLGCLAIKQVQRCDEDCSVFDVTYKGLHTCRSAEVEKQWWPFAFHHSLFPLSAASHQHLLPFIDDAANSNANINISSGSSSNANANLLVNFSATARSNPAAPPQQLAFTALKPSALADRFALTQSPLYNPNYLLQPAAHRGLLAGPSSAFATKDDDCLPSSLQPKMPLQNLETRKVPQQRAGEPTSAVDDSRDSSANDGSFELQLNTSKGTSSILGPNNEKELLGSMGDWPLFKHRDYIRPSVTTSEAMASPKATIGPSPQVRSFGEPMVGKEENLSPNDQEDDVPHSSTFDNMDLLGFFESMDSDLML